MRHSYSSEKSFVPSERVVAMLKPGEKSETVPKCSCPYCIDQSRNTNDLDQIHHEKDKGLPILIIPPEPASSHDFKGLLFFASPLKFHFFISGFAHDFTSFCLALLFLSSFFYFFLGLGFVSHPITCRGPWRHLHSVRDADRLPYGGILVYNSRTGEFQSVFFLFVAPHFQVQLTSFISQTCNPEFYKRIRLSQLLDLYADKVSRSISTILRLLFGHGGYCRWLSWHCVYGVNGLLTG